MKRRFWMALTLAAAAGPAAAGAAELVDRVLVRVNDGIISQGDFETHVARLSKDSAAPMDPAKLRLFVLEQMIRQRLVEGKAATLDLKVNSDEIDESVERVKEQYALKDDAEFDKALAANGLSRETLRGQLHDSILTNKLLSREVPVNLSDDAVRTEYERTKEQKYPIAEKARVSEILVRFDPRDPASREAAGKKISGAREELKAAKSFADVARTYSEGPGRARGGDLGVVSRGDLTEALDAAIFAGAPADPVELNDGFALLSITDRQKASFRPFDDVKEEIRKKMSDEIYEKKFGEYLVDLRKNAFVKIFDKDLETQDEAFQKEKPSS